MAKKNSKKSIDDCLDHAASANECTGALQRMELDLDELAKFHKEFNS
ncbi:MAG: hypothetical protein ACI4MB_02105 [Candidatus Coproplasma sp.]